MSGGGVAMSTRLRRRIAATTGWWYRRDPGRSDLARKSRGRRSLLPIASSTCAVLEAATVQHVRDQLLRAELATPEEIDAHLANLARADLDLMLAPMITVWGRKPADNQTTGRP
jgi:hypothetical protein